MEDETPDELPPYGTVTVPRAVLIRLEHWRDAVIERGVDSLPAAMRAPFRAAMLRADGKHKGVVGLGVLLGVLFDSAEEWLRRGDAGSYVVTAPGTATTPMVIMRTGASLVEIAPSGPVAPSPAVDGVVPVAGPVDVWHGDDAAERISRGEPPDDTIRGLGTARELTPEERAEYDALHGPASAAWVERVAALEDEHGVIEVAGGVAARRDARLADADRQRAGFDHRDKPEAASVFRARIASVEVTVTSDADAASRSAPKPRKKVRKR